MSSDRPLTVKGVAEPAQTLTWRERAEFAAWAIFIICLIAAGMSDSRGEIAAAVFYGAILLFLGGAVGALAVVAVLFLIMAISGRSLWKK